MRRRLIGAALGLCALGAAGAARPHGRDSHGSAVTGFTVRRQQVALPAELALVRMDGRSTNLARLLDVDDPVIVNFVFTTCSTICSTQTATLASLQRLLRDAGRPARFFSFTIDPDNDTPDVLRRFAAQFDARWEFLTGHFDDLVRQQQAFDVYRGAKSGHPPVVMMRGTRGAEWLRIEGHPSARELQRVYERLRVA